jgi:hypothetical protein
VGNFSTRLRGRAHFWCRCNHALTVFSSGLPGRLHIVFTTDCSASQWGKRCGLQCSCHRVVPESQAHVARKVNGIDAFLRTSRHQRSMGGRTALQPDLAIASMLMPAVATCRSETVTLCTCRLLDANICNGNDAAKRSLHEALVPAKKLYARNSIAEMGPENKRYSSDKNLRALAKIS